MKIKFWNKIIVVGGLMSLLTSCSDYLDINTDPNRVSEAALSTQLTGCMTSSASAQYSAAFTLSQITQHLAAAAANSGSDIHGETRLAGAWSTIYLGMANMNDLIKLANSRQSPHYAGIGQVLLAYNLGTATDIWGDVPFSQAFDITKTFYPAYDAQQSVYQNVQKLLDDAIVNLNTTSSVFVPRTDDLIFGGDLAKWRRLANSLKARYAIHLTKKGANAAATATLAALNAGAMTANADDMQVGYNATIVNPWHSIALGNNTGNFTVRHSEQLADAMNGTTYGVWDPRLPIIAGARAGVTNTWKGNVNGTGAGGTLDFLATTWHSTQTAPIVMMTFAEQKFIEAEARFLANGGTASSVGTTAEAYNAYLAGITANLTKLGVADTARTRYLAAPQVAVGAANLTLAHIMTEKWKALFIQAEAWVDMRRYDYATTIYKDLALPTGHTLALGGQWIRRAEYPLDEFSRNGEQVRKAQKFPTVKMWWDE